MCYCVVGNSLNCRVYMFVYFVGIKFSWILFNFLSTIIYGVLYTLSWCLRYNICSAWFLDIRISTCFTPGVFLIRSIKTNGRVSAAKKAVWCTSVLFTGTANSPFSAPHISITTKPISIKFTYFMSSIYATLHTKFERNRPSSSRDMCSWKLPYFLHLLLLLLLRTVLQK